MVLYDITIGDIGVFANLQICIWLNYPGVQDLDPLLILHLLLFAVFYTSIMLTKVRVNIQSNVCPCFNLNSNAY